MDGIWQPIFNISHMFQGAKASYLVVKKRVFAIIMAVRKLCPNFQVHKVVLVINDPLKKKLHDPINARCLVTWPVKVTEFYIEYRFRKAIKAQVIVDIISDFNNIKT